jgi:hypothetical protein
MTDEEARRAMVRVLVDWLEGRKATDDFIKDYWTTRSELLDSNWGAFTGAFGQIMSPMDTASDSYSSDPDRPDFQIDEAELRREAQAVLYRLRKAGLQVF